MLLADWPRDGTNDARMRSRTQLSAVSKRFHGQRAPDSERQGGTGRLRGPEQDCRRRCCRDNLPFGAGTPRGG